MSTPTELFSATGIIKQYPAVRALDGIDVVGRAGEVLAICGANGAGKSTFARILAGVEHPTAGRLVMHGRPVSFRSPIDAEAQGVLLMHQEPLIIDDLSIAENLWIRRLRGTSLAAPPAGKDELTRKALAAVDLGTASPSRPAGSLSAAQRQLLALARAHIIDHDVLILDETTASMTASYFETVVDFVAAEKAAGKCVVIVSHKLDEIFRVASRILVLRDGRDVGDLIVSETDAGVVSELMAGSAVRAVRNEVRRISPSAQTLFEATEVRAGSAKDVSLSVHEGEVVGVYGLVGSGRSSFARAITGQTRRTSGRLTMRGRGVRVESPAAALRSGIAYISEDRKREGFVPAFSNAENISLGALGRVSMAGVISLRRERQLADRATADYAIKGAPGVHTATLSGGNQQKVCVASRIASGADLLVFDEPTKGVDIAAKQNIYEIILAQAAEGKGVVVISSEEDEILAVASRIVVFRNGRIVTEFDDTDSVTRADLIHAALGSEDR